MNVFEYLPHQGPALLITEVLSSSDAGSTCLGQVPADSPFVRDGRFPAFLALEMGAQAAAAGEAHHRAAADPGGAPLAGFIVRFTRASFSSPSLPIAATYRITTGLLQAAPPLRTWSCRVEDDGEVVAEAEISTFAGGAS